jgi:putative ATPase
VLQELNTEELKSLLLNAIRKDVWFSTKTIEIKEWEALLMHSGGDGRKLLNLFEIVADQFEEVETILINNAMVDSVIMTKTIHYDKDGEEHYNIISAFIKSIRGSDPNASVYYLARMLEGGEKPDFIARRMLILASEDIGNANPNAMLLAGQCFQSVRVIGMPEARIILSQCAIYLACSPKSNASYLAIEDALKWVRKTGNLPVPLALRNAPTSLMKELNYGNNYAYAHDYENNFVDMEFLPEKMKGQKFFEPGPNARENEQRQFLRMRWKEKYGY